jgi:transcription elongation factor GreA-like protein
MKKRKNSIFSLFLTRIQYIKKINFLCNRMNEVTVLTIFGTHTQNT